MTPALPPRAAAPAPPRSRAHRLVVVLAAAAVVVAGAFLFWWRAFGWTWPPGEEGRPSARADVFPGEPPRPELIRLAFPSPDGRALEEETREVALRPGLEAAAGTILAELRAGSRQGRGPALPPGVQVRHIFVDRRGVVYVDLSREFLGDGQGPDPWAPVVRAAQVVAASLGMSLPEIAQVQVLADGREIPVLADGVDLRRPIPASLPPRPPDTNP